MAITVITEMDTIRITDLTMGRTIRTIRRLRMDTTQDIIRDIHRIARPRSSVLDLVSAGIK